VVELEREFIRVSPAMENVGQDVAAARQYILSGTAKALPAISDTRLKFEFLASPVKILGDANGRVCGLEVEDTSLSGDKENPKARGLGTYRVLDVDTVVFCIGTKWMSFGCP
jgi:NADPH-dependent glutamate synthase beta subunit-like oxidoreductase